MILAFETLRNAWTRITRGNPKRLNQLVPGLVNPAAIFLRRVEESEDYLVVEFKGFEQAVQDPTKDIPLLKRSIQTWLRKFSSQVQIGRGEPSAMVIRMAKKVRLSDSFDPTIAQMSTAPIVEHKYERKVRPRNLTNITMVVPVGEE